MREYPDVRLIAVPYDSGHYGHRMGAGPLHLLNSGLPEALQPRNRSLIYTTLHPETDPPVEVATAFELDSLVSRQVHEALAMGEFPLVLSGNCNTAVGTLAGVGASASAGTGGEGLGIVWFDGHPDFNTPETTTSGFSDNMGLSIAVGHCWDAMAECVPGFSPVAEKDVVLVGVSEIEPAESVRLGASEVTVIEAECIRREGLSALGKALDGLASQVGRVYVHLDLDVLDPARVGRANEYAPEGGLGAEELQMALLMVRERCTIAAAGIASYDPVFDADGRVLGAVLTCAGTLASLVGPAL